MHNTLPWWMGGILMSCLLMMTFWVYGANSALGASSYVPYFAGALFNLDHNQYGYLKEVQKSGAWQTVFLLGVLFGGFVTSIFITKTFKITLIPYAWKKYKNNSVVSRLLWSFTAGFFMIIGARLADGCTSGHFLSGMSQMAISSMVFGGVVMVTLIITGKLFYNTKDK